MDMSAARTSRIVKEVQDFKSKCPWGIFCYLEKEDTTDIVIAEIMGPLDTPYENGKFKLRITLPDNYPFEPPLVKFLTPVYHPNIDKGGRICMDLLKMPPRGSWVPTITLLNVLIAIQILLANPNPEDPLMIDIANKYVEEKDVFMLKAKTYTEKYAMDHVIPKTTS